MTGYVIPKGITPALDRLSEIMGNKVYRNGGELRIYILYLMSKYTEGYATQFSSNTTQPQPYVDRLIEMAGRLMEEFFGLNRDIAAQKGLLPEQELGRLICRELILITKMRSFFKYINAVSITFHYDY